jgi:hypothetical protein
VSDTEHLVHDIYFPMALRVILGSIGAFFFCIAPYELWRGVWPLNVASPFFGMLMLAGMGGGVAALSAGLLTPQQRMVFSRGWFQVEQAFLWKTDVKCYDTERVDGIVVMRDENMEGPDSWFAVVQLVNGDSYRSRPFETEVTAQKHAADFRRALYGDATTPGDKPANLV